jgi:hypothetical protein
MCALKSVKRRRSSSRPIPSSGLQLPAYADQTCGPGHQPGPGVDPYGAEYCGIVEEVGSAVRSIKPGQFVIGSFFASDNTCPNFQAGTGELYGITVQGRWKSDGIPGYSASNFKRYTNFAAGCFCASTRPMRGYPSTNAEGIARRKNNGGRGNRVEAPRLSTIFSSACFFLSPG